jgi:hypothetical protein
MANQAMMAAELEGRKDIRQADLFFTVGPWKIASKLSQIPAEKKRD